MAVQDRGKTAYPIYDAWFDSSARKSGDYVDIDEIRQGVSSYVTELGLNPQLEAARAGFTDMGVLLGDTDVGESVVGVLMGQADEEVDRYVLTGHLTHPLCFKRIYFSHSWKRGNVKRNVATDAREIKFLGSTRR